jgi:hypothetical protein
LIFFIVELFFGSVPNIPQGVGHQMSTSPEKAVIFRKKIFFTAHKSSAETRWGLLLKKEQFV